MVYPAVKTEHLAPYLLRHHHQQRTCLAIAFILRDQLPTARVIEVWLSARRNEVEFLR
jgi:hypothetical protein